jgi:hypothetical protein
MRLSTAPRASPCVLVRRRSASRPRSAWRSNRCTSWGGWWDAHNARVRLPTPHAAASTSRSLWSQPDRRGIRSAGVIARAPDWEKHNVRRDQV